MNAAQTCTPQRPGKARAKFAAAVSSTVGSALFLLAVVRGFRYYFDLGVYRGAVRYWLRDGGDLYAFQYHGSDFGFTYPPFAALVLSPLAVMSWPVAVIAAVMANISALVLLLRWFLVPTLRRHSAPVWVGCLLAFCALLMFEPVRATLRLGQINLVLLTLVCFDQRTLRNGRWAGIGIGIAAAVKLVPAVFIGYLIASRQYRAALVASGTAITATLLACVVAPNASRSYWTDALWETDRVGQLDALSNQSLRGVSARLEIGSLWWLVVVGAVLAIWFVKVRRAAAVDDHQAGFALTGTLGCLISPVTWIHHLVWLLPALFVLFEAALAEPDLRRRRLRIGTALFIYLILCTRLMWLRWGDAHGWTGAVASNGFVWISLALLAMMPIGPSRGPAGAQPAPLIHEPAALQIPHRQS